MQGGQVWPKGISNQPPDQGEKSPQPDKPSTKENEPTKSLPAENKEPTDSAEDQPLPGNPHAVGPEPERMPADHSWNWPAVHPFSEALTWDQGLAFGILALGSLPSLCPGCGELLREKDETPDRCTLEKGT